VPGDYQTSRDGEIVACLLHGWEFDIRTGQSWCDPERLRVRTYGVQVEPGGAVPLGAGDLPAAAPPAPGMVRGPYLAQTYPVTTDGQYVVVDLGRHAS
jgi:3-phenylpropionate/trans-cinnamate dioxygenase ferredoxin subunit